MIADPRVGMSDCNFQLSASGGALTRGIYPNQGVLRLVLFASNANLCS